MITSIAVTFNSKTPDTAREEADKLFTSLFGKGKFAVGGVEVTPYEIGEPYEAEVDLGNGETVMETRRDVISWQGTFAAHPVSE